MLRRMEPHEYEVIKVPSELLYTEYTFTTGCKCGGTITIVHQEKPRTDFAITETGIGCPDCGQTYTACYAHDPNFKDD